jgi:hypothetical protein
MVVLAEEGIAWVLHDDEGATEMRRRLAMTLMSNSGRSNGASVTS